MEKFVVMTFNMSHPSGEAKPFLMTDDDDNTLIFDTETEAEKAANDGAWGPFVCAVVDLSKLKIIC